MVTALESKRQLVLLGEDAADTARWMVRRTSGRWESRRLQLLDTVPEVTAFYSESAAVLAADLYDDARSVVAASAYAAVPVVLDRTVKIRRGVAWASQPLSVDDAATAEARMAVLLQSEVVRPYRDTIIENRKRDPACAGWKRLASGSACGFCKALAARGAVYKQDTAHFAAHDDCLCTCAPVFYGGEMGPEASVMQYMASGRRRTPAERAQINAWAASYE